MPLVEDAVRHREQQQRGAQMMAARAVMARSGPAWAQRSPGAASCRSRRSSRTHAVRSRPYDAANARKRPRRPAYTAWTAPGGSGTGIALDFVRRHPAPSLAMSTRADAHMPNRSGRVVVDVLPEHRSGSRPPYSHVRERRSANGLVGSDAVGACCPSHFGGPDDRTHTSAWIRASSRCHRRIEHRLRPR